MIIPEPAKSLLENFHSAFSKPSFHRAVLLTLAAIVTVGRRTVANILRSVQALSFGHASSYNRLFSHRRCRSWIISRRLSQLIVERLCEDNAVIRLAGDDTVDGHKGKRVFGKGCHRDAVKSTHKFTAFRWGHKWVVLSILVRLPMTHRLWALPCMVALYRPKKEDDQNQLRHKTPADLMRQMLLVMIHWFPRRKFIFCGDQGFGKHEIACLGSRYPSRLIVISKFYPDANLHDPPPLTRSLHAGRPRLKGKKIDRPKDVVARTKRKKRLHVNWYGGGQRNVAVVDGRGSWYRAGSGLVPLKWVYVEDRTGTHRDEYFYSTDPDMDLKELVEGYTSRWSIEVTFEEMRSHMGLETTRGWTKQTVLRMAPMLFILYSFIVLLYAKLPKRYQSELVHWVGKHQICFSDVVANVRRWLWQEWIFANLPGGGAVAKLPRKLQLSLLNALAPAA